MKDILRLVKRDFRDRIPQGREGLDISVESLIITFQVGLLPILSFWEKVGERCGISIFGKESTFSVGIEHQF